MNMLRTAVVTGASAGIGRELVRILVRERGMTVLATARREDRLTSLAAELPAGRVQVLAGDIACPLFRDRLWNHAERVLGGVDCLFNNAGVGDYGVLVDQDPAVIDQEIAVNLTAVVDLTRRAVGHMRLRGGGQVVQVSSVLGFMGIPGAAVYAATKHAVNGLTSSLQYELHGTGVRVWAACPGRTESEFRASALGSKGNPADLPRGEPAERVARAIVRQLDGRKVLFMPTAKAWLTVVLARRFPELLDWIMARWAPGSHLHVIVQTKQNTNM